MTRKGFLKSEVIDYFEQVELSEQQLAKLNELQNKYVFQRKSRFKTQLAIAAMLMMVCFSALLWNANYSILPRTAAEIAQNHVYLDEIDVESDNFTQIAEYFKELSFVARLPENDHGLDFKSLIGARYCSIQGNKALQLKFTDQQSNVTALYIAAPSKSSENRLRKKLTVTGQPYVQIIDDLAINVWFEDDLLFAISQQH